jgi:hypothetical protein
LLAGGTLHLTPTLSAPKGGEGELLEYHLHHTPNVFHHIPVPKPDHAIASAADFLSPQLIRAERDRVLPAIQLDHELRRRTRKVHHISAYRMLPAKPMWAPELAQLSPQPLLSLRHISPEPPDDHRP